MDEEQPENQVAKVSHAVIAEATLIESRDIHVTFMSGEGFILDDNGDSLDPLFFSVWLRPLTDESAHEMLDELTAWKNRDTALDITVVGGSVTLYSPADSRVIKITC